MKSFYLAAVPLLLLFAGGPAKALVYEDEVLADSPLGYWQFEETAGAAVDSSGNLRDGTYMLGVTPGVSAGVPSIGGTAAEFDGTTGYVNLPGAWGGGLMTEVTVEAWVNTAEPITDDFQAIMGGHDPNAFAHLSLHSAGNSGVYTDVGFLGLPIPPATPTGVWRHVVMTAKSGESMIYVDGVQLGATSTAEFSFVTESSNLDIGRGHVGTRWFKGLIDEVAIYETALSEERVKAHFNTALGLTTLTWDNVGPNLWGSTHWTGGPPDFPDETAYAIVNDGNTHTITVAEDRAAYSLTVDGGGIAIDAHKTLAVTGQANFASGTTLALGDGAGLTAAAGSIDTVTIAGNGTIGVTSGNMPVTSLTNTGAGTFTKQGAGTLTLDNSDGTGVTAGASSAFEVAGGTLRSNGHNPLDQSTQLLLSGGTFSFSDVLGTPGSAPADAVAHWTFDTDASDTTGSHSGVLGGGAAITGEAKVGAGALDLRGVSGYVDISSTVLDAESNYSMAFFLSLESLPGLSAIFANDSWFTDVGNTLHVNVGATGLPEAAICGTSPWGQPTSLVPIGGSWVHVAFVYDSATATTKSYFNGIEETTTSHSAGPLVGAGGATIGAWDDSGFDTQTRFLDGRLDDFLIYNRALTAVEVANMAGALITPDMDETHVTVTGDSAMDARSATDVAFGVLTMQQGILSTTGTAGISFTRTDVPEGTTGLIGFDPQVPTDYGEINVNDSDITIAKAGPGIWTLETAPTDMGANSNWEVQDGTLAVVGEAPLAGRPVTLAGGTLAVRGTAGTPGAPPADAVGHWTFDTNGSDATGNHDGTLDGGASITGEAKIGAGSLDLRGVDGYVDIPSTVLDGEESCSIAFYVSADSLPDLARIFTNDTWVSSCLHVNILDTAIPESAVNGSFPYAPTVSAVPADGSWIHIAFAYDSTTATTKAYFNGVEETTTVHPAGPLVGVGPATIGAWDMDGGGNYSPGQFFDGRIDDMVIYDRLLTGGEVATMYGITAPDMSTTDLTVTGDSTLSMASPSAVSFRALTLKAGMLTAMGAEVGFTGTTIDEDATAVGVNLQVPVDLRVIDVEATDPVTFSKSGPVDLVMTSANVGSGFDKLTFNVQEGKLIGVHGSNPFGTAGLQLAGGELVLSSAGGSVLYDNPLAVTESGMVTAGAAGGGVDEALTVTLGSSPDNGVSIDPGKTLSLRSTGDYALRIAGPIDGPAGVISVAEGSVGLAGGGEVGSVRAAGGALSTAGADLAVQNLDVFAGVQVDTGESQVVVGNRMRLDKVSFVIDAEHTFAVSGSDLMAGGEVMLNEGTLSIGVPGPPSGAIAYWKFNEGPGSTIAVNSANPGIYDGMVTGATFVPDDPQRGRVLNFDGLGDYVDIPEMGDFWEEISYSLWLNINAVPDVLDAIIDGDWAAGGLHWSLRNDPRVMGVDINGGNMGIVGNSTFGADQIGQWHHLALTYKSGEELVLYVDGVEDSTHPVLARTILMGPRQIGAWNGSREMNAMYDDLFVYDRVLNPEEVQTLYGILGEEVLIDLPNTSFTVTGDQCTLQLDTYEDATLGNLTLEGSVALTVAGAPANVRDIVAGDGSMITGNLVVRGTISPGSSAGTLTIDSKGYFEMDLEDAGYAADLHGETNDLVIIQNGDADLGGTLILTGTLPLQAAGGSSVWGDVRRVVMECGDLGGENYFYGKFDPVISGTSYVSTPLDPDYLGRGMWLGGVGYYDYVAGQYVEVDPAQDDPYQSLQVTVFQAKAGDCNGDRSISFADFNDLANNYTGALATGTGGKDWQQGDFNGDTDVDFGDFNDLANNYTGAGVEYGPLTPAGNAKAAPESAVPGDAKLIVYLANTTGEDGVFHAAGDVVLSVEAGLPGLAEDDAPGMRINGYEVYSADGSLIADPSGVPYPLMGGAYMEESPAGIVAFSGLTSPLVVSGHQEFTLRWRYNAAATAEQDIEFLYGTSEGVVSGDVLYVVPEPGTLTLLLAACAAMALLSWRRRNKTELVR